ncbi:C4-dicarboxylate ABC transporter permease [Labrenzia sp. C1B10]|jgi:C4-dicarboxylate transporter DctM subunit|uniref:TRAP transporter large permease n=1 Tax=unclassified Labrenzia TaxID=2648686 RepID=UPI0003B90F1A|nr:MULTISPECIES: TRAP transporter large permease [unclassified Labrenzia]ERP95955.1 C4-dicarboxylate ABC transporter permease [Labrenzia sp. C1B10]ERS09555.1 C4-dicarboxylate ABC transporter permease [Labrenzia sp. C1B70]
MIFLLALLFVLFLIMGLPIAIVIGAAASATLYAGNVPLMVVPQQMFSGINSFALVAVPMFILTGDIMAQGEISRRLVAFADSLFGFVKGGLSVVSVLAGIFFAAISGSGAATTAAVGASLVPELKRKGYDPASAASLIAASGTIGVVIPPSVPIIIYAVIAQESVAKLFFNGFLPGLAMGAGLIVVALFQGHRRAYPRGAELSLSTIGRTLVSASWGLMAPLIILGGIFSGIFTPSEAAVVAVNYAIFVSSFIYRDLTLRSFYMIVLRAGVTTAVIMFVISASSVLSWILASWQVPDTIASLALDLSDNFYVLLFLIMLLILVTGVILETASALIILTPMLLPLATQLGIDTVHFGIIIVVGLAIGMVTPPVAVNLFVASTTANIPIEKIARAVVPYLLVLIAVYFLIAFTPSIF